MASVVEALALAMGNEGGARLRATLGIPLSADTPLNVIRQATRPAPPAQRVIGAIPTTAAQRLRTFAAGAA